MVCGTYGRAIVGQSTWKTVVHSKLLDSIIPDTHLPTPESLLEQPENVYSPGEDEGSV